MIAPENCTSMADVRTGVDSIDRQIVTLLGQRFRFMDAAARIKPERGHVRDEPRKAQVIDNARRAAEECGVPVDLVERLYEALVEGSIAYEFDAFDARAS